MLSRAQKERIARDRRRKRQARYNQERRWGMREVKRPDGRAVHAALWGLSMLANNVDGLSSRLAGLLGEAGYDVEEARMVVERMVADARGARKSTIPAS